MNVLQFSKILHLYDRKFDVENKTPVKFWANLEYIFGSLGIQFGFAIQNGNLSRISEALDADDSNVVTLYVAAPITELIVQPIIDYIRDNTWSRLGRKRLYVLWAAIAAS